MRLKEIVQVAPEHRTARHWKALGANHGQACVARLLRDGQLHESQHRAYLLAVIAGQHQAGMDAIARNPVEWNYYMGFIGSLDIERDVQQAEAGFERRASA